MRNHTIAAVALALLPVGARAADLGGLLRTKPVFQLGTDRKMYDVERCAVEKDTPVMPIVYRQPDRLGEELLVWDGGSGSLGGVAAAARLEGENHVTLTFWGREKMLRRIKPCLGLTDPG